MRIFLVRHGESEGNVDHSIYLKKPDHAINLTAEGVRQAEAAGEAFKSWYGPNTATPSSLYGMRMWTSPYQRTRQTAEGFRKRFLSGVTHPDSFQTAFSVIPLREHIGLVEQQFGLFDGIPDEDLADQFPAEYAHYKKAEDFEGRFWARMPLGESRFDVAMRVHQTFGTLKRDEERHNTQDLVIFTHGVVIRAFIMQWLHHPWEWMEAEKNPKNYSIRLIEGKKDRGYIWEGEIPPVESRTETI